jgi:5'-3' exonuclease
MSINGISLDDTSTTIDSAGQQHKITWTGNQDYNESIYKWGYNTSAPVVKEYDNALEEIKKLLNNKESEKMENKNVMKIYEVIVVDKKECEIIKQQKIVAKDTETAMLDLTLENEVKIKVKKNEIKFIFNELGSFEKVEEKNNNKY